MWQKFTEVHQFLTPVDLTVHDCRCILSYPNDIIMKLVYTKKQL